MTGRVPVGARPERDARPWTDRGVLPAGTAFQAVRTAAKLDFDVFDVFTMAAGAVTLSARF